VLICIFLDDSALSQTILDQLRYFRIEVSVAFRVLLPHEVRNVVGQGNSLHLFNLSVDYFIRQLSEIFNSGNSFVVQEIHEEGFSPEILIEIELLKFHIVNIEEIKDHRIFVLKYSFCLRSKGVLEVEQVHEVHERVPRTYFLVLAVLADSRSESHVTVFLAYF